MENETNNLDYEEQQFMFCTECGNRLPKDSDFCTNCGTKIFNETVRAEPKKKLTGKAKAVIIVAVCLFVAIGALLLVNQIGKASLQKQLMRDWERVESKNDSFYTLVLDFSKDEIEYNFDSFYFDNTLATYKYRIISNNKFKIDDSDTVYTIDFNDDKTMITITPALTSDDSYENWFHFDD